MSWKPVFQIGNDPKWYDNAQRFATNGEARASALARFVAWTMPTAYDAHESSDPVNYEWVDNVGDKMVNQGEKDL